MAAVIFYLKSHQELSTIMRHLSDYRHEMFSSTPDFFDIRDAADRLEREAHLLGDIICDHGLHDVFGAALLHRHFAMAPDELLVRRYKSNKYSSMTPEKTFQTDLAPYLWRIVDEQGSIRFYPLEFCYYETPSARKRYCAHKAHYELCGRFFAEFGRFVIERSMNNYVALSALHARDVFSRGENETLLEMTDEKARFITLEVATKHDVKKIGDTTKTLWFFSPNQRQVESAHCASHCYAHCYEHRPSGPVAKANA